MLLSMNPVDTYEAMLCRRLLVLDSQYMDYLCKTTGDLSIEIKEKYINSASKLMTRYDQTLETLLRYHRKGEQKVTVTYNHVTVNDGGKAVVDSQFNQKKGGGEGSSKKQRKNTMPINSYVVLCSAKSRQNNNLPCRQPAMKNGRCRMHGCKSTGPKSTEEKKRIAWAHFKHGLHTKRAINERKKMRKFVESTLD